MTDKCAICLDEMSTNLGVAVPCGHCFHVQCFRRWKEGVEARHADDEAAVDERHSDGRCKVPCPVCKRRVKKFHKVYLTVSQQRHSNISPSTEHMEQAMVKARTENLLLQRRLRDLRTLSDDQSDLLFRILPKYDHLKDRYSRMKREKKLLTKELEVVEEENWEFLLDSFEVRSQLSIAEEGKRHLEHKLKEVDGKNGELQMTWRTMQENLARSVASKEQTKNKLRKKLQNRTNELRESKDELARLRAGKKKLKEELIRSNGEVARLHKKLRYTFSSVRNKKSGKTDRRTAILIQP